jgi:hypothetical protein
MTDTQTQQILVFKTNILSQQQERNVRALLDKAAGILKWNFDHYDCDHVLRVVTDSLYPEYIQEIIRQAGFDCTELPD